MPFGITYWASKRVMFPCSDYYTAGGNITGSRTARDCRRLYVRRVISRHFRSGVYLRYDGLIYSLGFLVGWPIILFLIAERLRNLGTLYFADAASIACWNRANPAFFSACGSRSGGVYLIAQTSAPVN